MKIHHIGIATSEKNIKNYFFRPDKKFTYIDKNQNTWLIEYLESEGFKVDTFQNGLEALEALESKSYDLGLFDIKMPKMDGNELLSQV